MSKTHQHISSITDLDETQKYNLSIQLGGRTPLGFYRYYFDELPHHNTKIEAFNHVNQLYFDLYGEYRYEDHISFRIVYNRHLKNPR